ncbi:MAG: DNA helicase PcrA [Thermodesulfobacteriota bacterium]|nr:MAG: DNA helicase PcrA [Thermodesulfobacteriota bacterium]
MFLKGLNPLQIEAVTFGDGPLLILAGAGSGKTRVLTSRIAYLIREKGVRPEEVLAVTFTNKAAKEMRSRLEKLIGEKANKLLLGTFHSLGLRILREASGRMQGGISVYGDDEQLALIKTVMKETGLSDKALTPKNIMWRINRAKNENLSPGEFLSQSGDFFAERVFSVYDLYQKRLREMNALDFGDLICEPIRLLKSRPALLKSYQDRIRYILVDEYQDTNHAQYIFTRIFSSGTKNLLAVGDPDQSIYAWRGACIDNIMDFQKDYPGAEVLRLEQNYRSTGKILGAANSVIEKNLQRMDKNLWTENPEGEPASHEEAEDEHDEARRIIKKVKDLAGEKGRDHVAYREMAVFYRTNAQSRVFEEKLIREGIPYTVVGGVRFYDRKEIRDAISYLRVMANPADAISFARIVNTPARGIGKVTLKKIIAMSRAKSITLIDALAEAQAAGLVTKTGAARFIDALKAFRDNAQTESLHELTLRLLEDSGYIHALQEEKTEEALGRIENIFEFISAIKDFEGMNPGAVLSDFLDHIALISDIDAYEGRNNRLTLMTLHSAKGLEFRAVFIAGLEEGLFPHSRSMDDEGQLEEERRLLYVGMTRAMERLFLFSTRTRTVFGETRYQTASRFIDEIDPSFIERKADPGVKIHTDQVYYTTEESQLDDIPIMDSGGAYAVGMKVMHKKFGVGVIKDKSGAGEEIKLTVKFFNCGTKKLVARYAALVPVF